MLDYRILTAKTIFSSFFVLYGFIGLKILSTYLLFSLKKERERLLTKWHQKS
jgi:hypothetical protein